MNNEGGQGFILDMRNVLRRCGLMDVERHYDTPPLNDVTSCRNTDTDNGRQAEQMDSLDGST